MYLCYTSWCQWCTPVIQILCRWCTPAIQVGGGGVPLLYKLVSVVYPCYTNCQQWLCTPAMQIVSSDCVPLIFKSILSVNITGSIKYGIDTHFEQLICNICTCCYQFKLCIVYQPPPSTHNAFEMSTFFKEWPLFLE